MEIVLKDLLVVKELQEKDFAFFVTAIEHLFKYNQGKPIRVQHLSSILCTSERNLRRRCNKLFGVSPSELISRVKIERAKILLSQNFLVSDVAHILGFSSPSHFSRVFKRDTKYLPSSFLSSDLLVE
jgi:AraC-like DNA-binding protein